MFINKYIKRLIIIGIQWSILVGFSILVVSHLLTISDQLPQWQGFFQKHQRLFLGIHGLGYLILYVTWPRLITLYVKCNHLAVDADRVNQAISARNYLIGVWLVLELLFQWRS